MVDRLAPPRDPSRSPLVQTLFSFHDAPRGGVAGRGSSARVVHALPDGTAKADLNVIGAPLTDGSVDFVWEHADAFDAATAARIAAHHARLLEEFVERPRRARADAAARRAREPATPPRHDPAAALPAGGGARSAARTPRRWREIGLTYAELWARAGGLAGALRAAGVAPGDRVGMALPRSADAVVAHLAAARAGAVDGGARPRPPRGAAARDPRGGRRARGDRRRTSRPTRPRPDPGDLDRAAARRSACS